MRGPELGAPRRLNPTRVSGGKGRVGVPGGVGFRGGVFSEGAFSEGVGGGDVGGGVMQERRWAS